jgi:hypothetical protein
VGRDRLAAARHAIALICARTCRGAAVLDDVAHVAARLRQRPVRFAVRFGARRYRVMLDEGALAELVYAGGDPRLLRRVPRAVAAARTGDLHPLRRLLSEHRRARAALIADPNAPSLFSVAQSFATQCHDYPHAFSFDDPLPARRAAYDRALSALDPRPFRPFSPRGWSRAGFEATDTCVRWPADPTAAAPLAPGAPLPDVPVLVLSGDLDTNNATACRAAAGAPLPARHVGADRQRRPHPDRRQRLRRAAGDAVRDDAHRTPAGLRRDAATHVDAGSGACPCAHGALLRADHRWMMRGLRRVSSDAARGRASRSRCALRSSRSCRSGSCCRRPGRAPGRRVVESSSRRVVESSSSRNVERVWESSRNA